MAKSKLIDEVIQEDIVVSEEVIAEVKKVVIPESKKKDKPQEPGHGRRDFRN